MTDAAEAPHESHARSVAKAVTWRAVGSMDTFLLSLLVTGNLVWAGSIASIEVISKIVLFYIHERVWRRVRWGQDGAGHTRSVAKAVSWRAVGTADTFLLSWLITGHPGAAASIASLETLTKIVLYYLHERVWRLVPWGRVAPAAPVAAAA